MRKALFEKLQESVRQMNAIRRGELKGKITTAADLRIPPDRPSAP